MATLRLAASPEMLAHARDFIRQQLLAAGMDVRTDDVVLAVNEAVTNAVRHAYPESAGEIEIIVETNPNGIAVTVRDRGRGPGHWQDTAGAGFGSAIMATTSDSLRVEGHPDSGGTEVRLQFRAWML